MCDACLRGGCETYAELYETAYVLESNMREPWIRRRILTSRSYCLAHRRRVSCNIQRMQDQSILSSLSSECRGICKRAAANDANLIKHRTFRLVHRILRHTYRPGGRMFRRTADGFCALKA